MGLTQIQYDDNREYLPFPPFSQYGRDGTSRDEATTDVPEIKVNRKSSWNGIRSICQQQTNKQTIYKTKQTMLPLIAHNRP